MDRVLERLKNETSRNPQGTLQPGFEKYALGRRFFVTKKGYSGLGPKEVAPGDRVAVVFVLEVALLVRNQYGDDGRPSWEVLGETYVHRIMHGEVLGKWRDGYVEADKLTLR